MNEPCDKQKTADQNSASPHCYLVRFVTGYVGGDGEITAAKEFELPIPPCVGLVLEAGSVSIEIKSGDLRFDAANGCVVVYADLDPLKLGYDQWLQIFERNEWDVIEAYPR